MWMYSVVRIRIFNNQLKATNNDRAGSRPRGAPAVPHEVNVYLELYLSCLLDNATLPLHNVQIVLTPQCREPNLTSR